MREKREKEEKSLLEQSKNYLSGFLKWLASIIVISFMVVIAMKFLENNYDYLSKLVKTDLNHLLVLLYILLAIILQINIHEFGHLAFGKLAGYRLISYRFSIFSWNYENEKMNFALNFREFDSGSCIMIPSENEGARKADLLFYAGGIVFNFFISIVLLIAFFYVEGFLAGFFFFTALIGFLVAIKNLLPFTSDIIPTDGKFIWDLIFNRPQAIKLIRLKKLAAQLSAGIPPTELNIPLIEELNYSDFYDLLFVNQVYMKALYEDDEDTYREAARIMEENLAFYPSYALPALYYELCYVACISGEEDKAREYYQKVRKTLEKDRDINGFRVKAYYEYYINKDREKALAYAQSGLAVKDKYPVKGEALLEEKLIKKILVELEE